MGPCETKARFIEPMLLLRTDKLLVGVAGGTRQQGHQLVGHRLAKGIKAQRVN